MIVLMRDAMGGLHKVCCANLTLLVLLVCVQEKLAVSIGVARCTVGAYPNFYQGGLCHLVGGEW